MQEEQQLVSLNQLTALRAAPSMTKALTNDGDIEGGLEVTPFHLHEVQHDFAKMFQLVERGRVRLRLTSISRLVCMEGNILTTSKVKVSDI